ncbi:hypothetical protein, partial [Massilia sp. Root335]|uniref:hypothetical protein n=1 Tax=Massilia sp. Root335 TaxID=1736517 RepID=UPI001E34B424
KDGFHVFEDVHFASPECSFGSSGAVIGLVWCHCRRARPSLPADCDELQKTQDKAAKNRIVRCGTAAGA